jgi:hypothetical protein
MFRSALLASLLGLSVFATGCAAETAGDESEDDLTREERVEKRNMETLVRFATADIEEAKVVFPASVKAPKCGAGGFRSPQGPALYGVDWFQKWPGGVNADHSWDNGTEFGKRCMVASVARFEAIMKDAPEELLALNKNYSSWSGGFYNWVDDYSGKSADGQEASGDARAPRLWAWRTGLTKWIAQTAKDGSCLLPTRTMVVEYVANCSRQLSEDPENPGKLKGEMQGCSR